LRKRTFEKMSTIPHQGKDSVWVDESVAERYANAENATAPFAKLLVSKAKWDGEVNAFDLATGTGAAVKAVYEAVPKDKWSSVHVTGTDVSQPMLEYLQHRGEEAGWSGLSTQIVDGNVRYSSFPLGRFNYKI
jgi:ubiquinone/menaquinone biosynthesis C-methylase UbiE